MSKLGVVILNYKDANTTIKLCNLIKDYTIINKIVIVDNLSPDDSFEKLQELESNKVDIIQTYENGGYSYGNNFGAFYLIERYDIDTLVIANPDVEFSEKFLVDCITAMQKYDLACVSGCMLDASNNICKLTRGINSFLEDCIDCTVIIKNFIKRDFIDLSKKFNYVELVPGSLFLIDAEVFKRIKGFDDRVFLYCEERILGTKLKKYGYTSGIISSAMYIHRHSVSINKSLSKIKQLKLLYNSRKYYYESYTEISNFKKLLLDICMLYGLSIRKIIYKILY